MGQEEVSVIRKSFEDNGNLISKENREKDIQISGKELVMKTNGKKRIFVLLMCVMMIMSSMSVWAAYASRTIGGDRPNEQALCELYLTSSKGQAFTTVNTNLLPVETTIVVKNSSLEEVGSNEGESVATVRKNGLAYADSTHKAGPYYITISVSL